MFFGVSTVFGDEFCSYLRLFTERHIGHVNTGGFVSKNDFGDDLETASLKISRYFLVLSDGPTLETTLETAKALTHQ